MKSESNRILMDAGRESDLFGIRLIAGDHDAYLVIWNYGRRYLIPWYLSLKFSYGEAEDLWSATFVKLFGGNCKTFDPEVGPINPWLEAVAKRAAFRKLRERKQPRAVSLEQGYV